MDYQRKPEMFSGDILHLSPFAFDVREENFALDKPSLILQTEAEYIESLLASVSDLGW